MSHTYAANLVHCVFSTKAPRPSIPAERQQKLWAYILGIARNTNVAVMAIGGVSDHIHVLISLPPTRNLAKVMCDFKANSSRWLKEPGLQFAWQEGYGAFSVSPSRVADVQPYIRNQSEHHKRRNFEEEFIDLLRKSGIAFDPKYVLG
jgi:putative transposase